MENIVQYLYMVPAILFSLTVHEYAHGRMALHFGDTTARDAGRLTLNPLKHLDPIGTLAFFIIRFGWAKPVPVNLMNLRNPLRDSMYVAFAGPASNILLALICSSLLHMEWLVNFLLTSSLLSPILMMLLYGVILNVILGVFNLIPVPPLDGSRIIYGVLPRELAMSYSRIEPYGMFILIGMMFLGLFQTIITPVVHWTTSTMVPEQLQYIFGL